MSVKRDPEEGQQSSDSSNSTVRCTAQVIFKRSMAAGIQAARQNRAAGIALWIFGCAIIASYYLVPAFNELLQQLGQLKTRWGFLFSAISTGLFGGLIPSLIQVLVGPSQASGEKAYPLSNTLFWAFKGMEIDLFYRLQAYWLGNEIGIQIVATKTVIDQLVYVPAIGLVNVVLFYLWRQCGYDFAILGKQLGQHWYQRRILPVLISNWLIWIPAVALIYCFPLALQIPVQNLILCFWVLLLTLLTAVPKQK